MYIYIYINFIKASTCSHYFLGVFSSHLAKKVETLGPVAELQLVIVKARDLHSHELSKMFQPTCNPACKATCQLQSSKLMGLSENGIMLV